MYKIIHFWPVSGGLGLRYRMLLGVLEGEKGGGRISVLNNPFTAIRGLLLNGDIWKNGCSLIIFTSLLSPVVFLLKIISPRIRVYYMVRGDEIYEASAKKRKLRVYIAFFFQWCLWRLIKAKHLFVSWDLENLFVNRYGCNGNRTVLPNTTGRSVPPSRFFDGDVAVVGDFCSIKDIEWVLEELDGSEFKINIYGNSDLPAKWKRPGIVAHGHVNNLEKSLANSTMLIIASNSEGYPNIVNDALLAGCAVMVHDDYPFKYFPLADQWKFTKVRGDLLRLLKSAKACKNWNYDQDNHRLREIVSLDWAALVRNSL